MSNWLDSSNNANCFKNTYVQGFVDISGGSIITRGTGGGLVIGGVSSLNGTVYLGNSIFVRSDGMVGPGTAYNGATPYYVDASYADVSGGIFIGNVVSYDISGTAQNGADILSKNTSASSDWSQLGATIFGEAVNDYAGYTTSFSADGTVVSVHLRGNITDVNNNYVYNGKTKVYEYRAIATQSEWDDISNNIGPTYSGVVKSSPTDTWVDSTTKYWVQLGADINNPIQTDAYVDNQADQSLSDVSLFKDTNENIYIAMTTSQYLVSKNYVRVYQYMSVSEDEWNTTYNTTSLVYTDKPLLISGGDTNWTENKKYWVQIGNQLEFIHDIIKSVAIAKDTSNNEFWLAYGSKNTSLHSYKLNGTSWDLISNNVDNSPIIQIALTADGRSMAYSKIDVCKVSRYIYNTDTTNWEWTQFRSTNINNNGQTCSPIAISGNGHYIAYQINPERWIPSDNVVIEQLSTVANAAPLNRWINKFEQPYYNMDSVALNYDGSILATGFKNNNDDGAYGMVRIFKYAVFTTADIGKYHYGGFTQNAGQPKPTIITSDNNVAPVVDTYYWMQIGSDITGSSNEMYTGSSVNLSADGTILVIGSYGANTSWVDTAYTSTNVSDVSSASVRLTPDTTTGYYALNYTQYVHGETTVSDVSSVDQMINPYLGNTSNIDFKDQLDQSITQIKFTQPDGFQAYRPYGFSISEIQVWVNDVNIASASNNQYQKDISASSIAAGSSLSYLNDASLGTSFECVDISDQWITMTFNQAIPLDTIQSIVLYTNSTTAFIYGIISLYNNNQQVKSEYTDNNGIPIVMFASGNKIGSYPNNRFKIELHEYLVHSITQIKLYKPPEHDAQNANNIISISEIQVWVNDVNIAAASDSQYQKDLSASSIGSGSSLSYLNDASLNTSFETDDIANQWITITFNTAIPLNTIQSIVIYTDSTTALNYTQVLFYNNEEFIDMYELTSTGDPVVMYASYGLVATRGGVRVYEVETTNIYSDVSGGYYDVSIVGGYNNDGLTSDALYVNGDTDLSGGLTVSGDVSFNAGNLFVAGDLSLNGTLTIGTFAANSINADAIDSTVDIEFANKLSVSAADLLLNTSNLQVASDVNYIDPNAIFDASTSLAANLRVPANIAIVDGDHNPVYGSYLTLTSKDGASYYNVGKSAAGIFNIVNQVNLGVYLSSGGTSFTGTSDARLKTNVAPLESAMDKIMALNPCTYQWKSEVESAANGTDPNTKPHVGFIAQEVEQVMPELVHPIDHPAGPDYKGVNTTDLIPYLVQTIQEQTKRIVRLQEKLAAIKNKQ